MNRDVVATLVALAAWCGAAVGMHAPWWSWSTVAVLALLGCGAAWFRWRGAFGELVLVLSLCVIAAMTLASSSWVRVRAERTSTVAQVARAGGVVRSVVVITGDPVRLRDGSGLVTGEPRGFRVAARVERLQLRDGAVRVRSGVLVIAPASWGTLIPGTRIETALAWKPAREVGVAAVGIARSPPVVVAGPPLLQRGAESLRRGLMSASPTRSSGGALVPALVVGDTSSLPEAVVDDMRACGLSHVTAVSGANVAIVLALMLLLARWLGVRGRWVLAVGFVTVAFFVVLARPEPSVLRAAVMGVIGLASALRGGARRSVSALASAVLVLLVVDPFLAVQLGFVLSVLATAGLILVAPWWTERLARFMPAHLAQAVAVAIGAQLMVSPVIVAVSGRIEPVALLANLLAEPAVAPATVLGFLAALLSPVSPALAQATAWCAAWPATWIVAVAARCSRLPWATLPWPNGWVGGLCVAVLLLGGAMAFVLRSHRSALVTAFLVLVALVALPLVRSQQWPPAGWLVIACDVGQGDGLLLRTADHAAVLVDAGPDARAIDRCLRTVGVDRLDAEVLTHFHVDHVQGLPGALHGRRVGPVLVSPLFEPPQEAAHVADEVVAVHARELVVREGSSTVIGPWRLTVLAPPSDPVGLRTPADGGSPPNNASVVLLVQGHGLRMLFTGDVELTGQQRLVSSAAAAIADVDVLKVAHHGSAKQDPEFLALTSPSIALISVGQGNRYGHPAPVTVATLVGEGALVGRTDADGDLAVTGGDGGPLRLIRRG